MEESLNRWMIGTKKKKIKQKKGEKIRRVQKQTEREHQRKTFQEGLTNALNSDTEQKDEKQNKTKWKNDRDCKRVRPEKGDLGISSHLFPSKTLSKMREREKKETDEN